MKIELSSREVDKAVLLYLDSLGFAPVKGVIGYPKWDTSNGHGLVYCTVEVTPTKESQP